MTNDNEQRMRRHVEDSNYDIAVAKRRSLDPKRLAKHIADTEWLWDVSAQIQFNLTLNELKQQVDAMGPER